MRIPKFWAEARKQVRANLEPKGRRQLTLRRWGWSDASEYDAQLHAQTRVDAAMDDAIAQGWPHTTPSVYPRERKVAYNGAEGVPIREEIVHTLGPDIITRNGYGALCLNTPDVMIVDVDDAGPAGIWALLPRRYWILAAGALLGLAIGLAQVFHQNTCQCPGSGMNPMSVLAFFAVLAVGAIMITKLARGAWLAGIGGTPGWVKRKLLAQGGLWAMYQTPAGVRAIRLDRTDAPTSETSQACLIALGSDPLYRQMCVRQNCYRARLTPKPWRMDFERWRGPVWPIPQEKLADRRAWVDAYDQARTGMGACRWIEDVGQGQILARNAQLQALHDQWALAPDPSGPIA